MSLTPESRPALPRGVRVHHDAVRGAWVLLAPERVLKLDEIGRAILAEVDGEATLAEIAARLAGRYGAPEAQVAKDVTAFLDGLWARRMLDA
jgi:pyrroloquinoline quinone biosynthesis protein D